MAAINTELCLLLKGIVFVLFQEHLHAVMTRIWTKHCLQHYSWITTLNDKGGQHNYRLGILIYPFKNGWKGRTGRFIIGLADEIISNVTRELQNIIQNFINQLAGLSTVISAQEVSLVMVYFNGRPTKCRNWIRSIEKYV